MVPCESVTFAALQHIKSVHPFLRHTVAPPTGVIHSHPPPVILISWVLSSWRGERKGGGRVEGVKEGRRVKESEKGKESEGGKERGEGGREGLDEEK